MVRRYCDGGPEPEDERAEGRDQASAVQASRFVPWTCRGRPRSRLRGRRRARGTWCHAGEPSRRPASQRFRRLSRDRRVRLLANPFRRVLSRVPRFSLAIGSAPPTLECLLETVVGSAASPRCSSVSRSATVGPARPVTQEGTASQSPTSVPPQSRLTLRSGTSKPPHGSVWTITSTISGWSRRMRSSTSLARAWASASARSAAIASVRNATSPRSVTRKRSSRGSAPVVARTISRTACRVGLERAVRHRARPARARRAAPGASARRRPRGRAQNPPLDRLGDVVRDRQRQLAGELQVERDLDARADVEDGDVVHLADAGDAERGGCGALAELRGLRAARRGRPRRRPEPPAPPPPRRVGGRVSLADGRARRDADDDVGEVAAGGAPHAQAAERHAAAAPLDRAPVPPRPRRPAPGP